MSIDKEAITKVVTNNDINVGQGIIVPLHLSFTKVHDDETVVTICNKSCLEGVCILFKNEKETLIK